MIPFPFSLTNTAACYQTARQGLKVRLVPKALKAIRDPLVIKGPLVTKDQKETKGLSGLKDLPGRVVRWWCLQA